MAQVQWLKLYIDIFDNEKIKKLLRNRDGDSYFRAWIQLLILAGKSNNKGAVLLGENIPMSLEDLAKVMHKTLPKLTRIIPFLLKIGVDIKMQMNLIKYEKMEEKEHKNLELIKRNVTLQKRYVTQKKRIKKRILLEKKMGHK